jgi:hypothetical protein
VGVVRDLEQGISRQPHPGSVERLAVALGLSPADSSVLAVADDGLADASGGFGGVLRLQVLGSLVVWRDGARVPLGGGKQRAVLGLLAVHPGVVVSLEAVGEVLWGGELPSMAVAMIQSHVSRLLSSDLILARLWPVPAELEEYSPAVPVAVLAPPMRDQAHNLKAPPVFGQLL